MKNNIGKYFSIIGLLVYIGSFYVIYPIIGNTLMILSIIPVLSFLLVFNLNYALLIQLILIFHRFIALKILGEDIYVLFSYGTITGTLLNFILIFLINFLKTLVQRGKKAEKKLIKQNKELKITKARAEESDRLKSSFLANMSHEIRTPMNAILGFLALLKDPSIVQEEKNTYIDLIDASGNQLMKLIDGIIDISIIEANKLSVIEKECKLNNLLSELHLFFQSSVELKKKPKVKLLIYKDLADGHDLIITDELRLRQVLINLIENAIKFTNSGFVRIKYQIKNKSEILFSVNDTGVGIPKKTLPIIFNHFRQGEETLARKYDGTGLGLTISKACVNLLGGEIGVSSEFRKGSTFHFTIPYKPITRQKEKSNTQPFGTILPE